MARSCQVKALTLSPAHRNINCRRVRLPVWRWHRRLNLFSIVDGPATQLTPPPVNHTFHGHINDPHYVAWPYGVLLCVCVCVWCMSTNACAGASALRSWKQIALETRPSSWSPPLESHCVVTVTEEIWPWSWEGNRNGLFASASECHPRCPRLSGESRGMSNGRRRTLAVWGHRGVTGSLWAVLRVHVNFSPFKY